MGFWDNERCEYCEGIIKEGKVNIYWEYKNQPILFENVSVGICQRCGERYYTPKVAEMLAKKKNDISKAKKEVRIPVLSF
jgi:YgiT-type zinc finger domain-containing protein